MFDHTLIGLWSDIDVRVNDIRKNASAWPCQKGCDACCKKLANIPSLTLAEWLIFHSGVSKLPQEEQDVIWQKSQFPTKLKSDSYVCPALNEDTGSCRAYDYRPTACRTYGYYVERGRGLHCNLIQDEVEIGKLADIVWGNYEVVLNKLSLLGGEVRSLPAWGNRLLSRESVIKF